MLQLPVLAPRNRYGRQVQPERGVYDCVGVSTDPAYVGWLWCRAFPRLVQKLHAVVTKLYARIVASLAGALYAVIAGDLDGVFAKAAGLSGVW